MSLFLSAINLIIILGIATFVWKKYGAAIQPFFWPAFIIKCLAGISLGIIYQRYYVTGDTFYLFDLARERANLCYTDPASYLDFLWRDADAEWKGAARSVFFVKIVSVVAVISNNSYWITSLWLSFLSFLGSLYLVRSIIRFFPGSKVSASLAFLFFPSIVFWGSGVIKESVALAALLFLSGMFLKSMTGRTPGILEFITAVIGFWVVWNLKYYWIAVFLPVVVTSLIVHYTSISFRIPSRLKLSFWIVLFAVLCLGVSLSHPNFYIERFLQVVVENHEAFVLASEPSDLIHYNSLNATWVSVASNAPWALFSGLFRPLVWEANTDLKVVVSLENLVVLILSITALVRIRDFFHTQNRLITMSVVVYIILLCTFLSLSTPNLGSLARYKVGFLPFFVFLIAYKNPVMDWILSSKRFRGLKKWLD